jgi:hypothetical protein
VDGLLTRSNKGARIESSVPQSQYAGARDWKWAPAEHRHSTTNNNGIADLSIF